MCDTPEYLEAPDNEDSEDTCEYCNAPAWDVGKYPELCFDCNMEAMEEEHWERIAEDRADREMFPEDYDYDHGGY